MPSLATEAVARYCARGRANCSVGLMGDTIGRDGISPASRMQQAALCVNSEPNLWALVAVERGGGKENG